jgi:hypothetical protein
MGSNTSGTVLIVCRQHAFIEQPLVTMTFLPWLLPPHHPAQDAGLCKFITSFVCLLHRCNMVPGYVAPCNQVAFSQPTGDGAALAAAFAGTQQFLVYGFE